jgi:hypothetical protein
MIIFLLKNYTAALELYIIVNACILRLATLLAIFGVTRKRFKNPLQVESCDKLKGLFTQTMHFVWYNTLRCHRKPSDTDGIDPTNLRLTVLYDTNFFNCVIDVKLLLNLKSIKEPATGSATLPEEAP